MDVLQKAKGTDSHRLRHMGSTDTAAMIKPVFQFNLFADRKKNGLDIQ